MLKRQFKDIKYKINHLSLVLVPLKEVVKVATTHPINEVCLHFLDDDHNLIESCPTCIMEEEDTHLEFKIYPIKDREVIFGGDVVEVSIDQYGKDWWLYRKIKC